MRRPWLLKKNVIDMRTKGLTPRLARNEMGANSDLDVLVIMPDGVHRRDTSTLVYRSLHRFGYAIDIVVATEGDLAEYSDSPGLVFRQALLEGKELYRAA